MKTVLDSVLIAEAMEAFFQSRGTNHYPQITSNLSRVETHEKARFVAVRNVEGVPVVVYQVDGTSLEPIPKAVWPSTIKPLTRSEMRLRLSQQEVQC